VVSHGPDCWRDSSSVRALHCDGAVVKRNHIFVYIFFFREKRFNPSDDLAFLPSQKLTILLNNLSEKLLNLFYFYCNVAFVSYRCPRGGFFL